MTLTIELPDDQVAALKAKAASAGLSLEDWLRNLATSEPSADPSIRDFPSIVHLQKSDPAEWARQFRAWAESHDRSTPLLSDEAVSRESIYGDEE